MNILRLCIAVILSSLFVLSAQADEIVSVKIGYASIAPSGSFAGNVGGTGTNINTDSLALGKSNNVSAEIAFQLGDGRLSASYLPTKFSGTSTPTTPITYNGRTFPAGTPLTSEMKLDLIDVGYTYYVVNMDDIPSRLQLGIEASVKSIKFDGKITSPGQSSTGSATLVIPTIGVRGRVALADFIGITGRIGYIGYNGNTFTDVDAQVEFSPIPTLGIYGGYRMTDVKFDSSGIVANTTFKGPFAGAFFRF